MEKTRRIEWVDVVKGMAVPLIIMGHTSTSPAVIAYIYSFHMPLFFLLSGYTAKRADNLRTYGKHLWKNFCHLIVPCIIVQFLIEILQIWMKTGTFQMLTMYKIKGTLWRLFWGCAWGWAGGAPSVGMLWFFFTMFWAKLIWEGIGLIFRRGNSVVCIAVAFFGIWYGPTRYLPQNLDIAMMVVLYYWIGSQIRHYEEEERLEGMKMPVFCVAIWFWVLCAHQGIYAELAIEKYPGLIGGILESLCGAFVFCVFGQKVAEWKPGKIVFSFLGRHTLLIVLIHHMDALLAEYWQRESWMSSFIARSEIVLGISLLIILVRVIAKVIFDKINAFANRK